MNNHPPARMNTVPRLPPRVPGSKRFNRLFSVPVSILIHASILVVGGLLISNSVSYTTQPGQSSVEVTLIAAQSSETETEESSQEETSSSSPSESEMTQPSPDDMLEIKPRQPEIPRASYKPNPTVKTGKPGASSGDGSSDVAGKDSTTLRASRGSSTATPSRTNNIAPVYPESSRRASHEGRVMLRVQVSSDGYVTQLRVGTSSGYALLDESALKAVRSWRFEPARAGGIAVASEVDVPVRFLLDKKN